MHGVYPTSTVRRMSTVFLATLIMIPSICIMPYATPLGGGLVRNVLVLEQCLPRLRPRSMIVILLGTGVHTIQS